MSNWTYNVSTGALTDPSGEIVAAGYAGAPGYINKATAVWREDLGPIPPGSYTVGNATDHPTCGPCSLPLEPDPDNRMFGRHSFLIHGDSIDDPGTASTGCIIMPRNIRDEIAASDCRELVVTV